MIAALSYGGRVLKNNNYIEAARRAFNFIFKNLLREDGRLLARYRDGEAAINAYADDYSFLIWGLIELYETTFEAKYLKYAIKLNDELIKLFWDDKNAGLFLYGSDSEELISRPKEIYDGAIPSANSVSTLNWLRLSRLTGNTVYEEYAQKQFEYFGQNINEHPSAYTFMLCLYIFSTSKSKEVIIVGEINSKDTKDMLQILADKFYPFTTTLVKSGDNINSIIPYISEYEQIENKATAYICENFSCHAPTTNISEFENMIQ
jgi:uncharacterized protein YyaL (SSP411 family)